MPSRRHVLLSFPMLLALPAAAQPRWPAQVDRRVDEVRRTLRTVEMDGFASVVANPQGSLLLDVREADEVAQGRIPGTLHIPRGLLEFRIWSTLGFPGPVDTSRLIYVHCANGNRAILAARQLMDVGFTNVVAVTMEFAAWQRAGHPSLR